MRIDEVTQPFGKQEQEPPTKRKKQQAVKSYKDVDKLKPKDDEEFMHIKVKDRKSTRLNSSHIPLFRMPSSA